MTSRRRQPAIRIHQPIIRFQFQLRHMLYSFGSGFLIGVLVAVATVLR